MTGNRDSVPRERQVADLASVPSTCLLNGAVAQLGERLLCKQEAVGSIPSSSTSHRDRVAGIRHQ